MKKREGERALRLFDETNGCGIALYERCEESVALAARDVLENLRRLAPGRKFDLDPAGRVRVEKHGGEPESYAVRVEKDGVRISGADERGCIYGLYAFSRMLGFMPAYRFTGLFPEEKKTLELPEGEVRSPARKVRFRGWFLNDEDLLSEFRGGGGERKIDYPYYHRVIAPEVLDAVLETALRMEMNLIIPSSFLDVMNPAEEALAELCVRRGFYISQHHVEPMGVSYFSARRYLDENGRADEPVSFSVDPEGMKEIWRAYAARWAKWGDKVIWQLGLRGKADVPVWKTDEKMEKTPEARGKLIGGAIAAQAQILREVLQKPFLSTVTLWLEGAELYGSGHLAIPEECMIVYSDIGLTQLFGEDFYRAAEKPRRAAGVYYHIAFFGMGPHLSEGCDPFKHAFCYREAAERGFLTYSILNVSNVRPLVFGCEMNSRVLADPESCDAGAITREILREYAGGDAAQLFPLVRRYFESIADLGKRDAAEYCKHEYVFFFHDFGDDFPYPQLPATDGFLRMAGRRVLQGRFFSADPAAFRRTVGESLAKWTALSKDLDLFAASHPASRRYVEEAWGFESFYMKSLTEWLLAVLDLKEAKGERKERAEQAVLPLRAVLERRKILEKGEWKGWHAGDKKINLASLIRETLEKA